MFSDTKPVRKVLPYATLNFGSDPEFFFARKTVRGKAGKIIGAEKIIPEEGVEVNHSKIIIDGVQAELNPVPYVCRQSMSHGFRAMFLNIKDRLKDKNITINWQPTVRVSSTELRTLKPSSRIFGCDPSMNAYKEEHAMPDPATYPFRSAGGHIHIGAAYPTGPDPVRELLKAGDLPRIVKVLDILVGNTCVLVDREEGNIERRKFYGRAGEYRAPKHGLEYRVLSNFWLRNYQMMSMVFGLVRLGMSFALDKEASERLLAAVSEADIRKAINENDFELAQANFAKVKPLINELATGSHSLTAEKMPFFEHFVVRGMKGWFKGDAYKHWTSSSWNNQMGWERFLTETVAAHLHGQKTV